MKSGDFFAIDHRVWGRVVDLGMNAAIVYLVLARGTGGDQRTTSWSTNAVEQRTSIGRPRIKMALAKLKEAGLVVEQRGGTKPRYYLTAVPDSRSTSSALTESEKRFLNALSKSSWVPKTQRYGSDWGVTQPVVLAERLVKKGVIESIGEQLYRVRGQEKPDWVWLPNDLVDGAAGETTPLELVRQSSKISALRLLIDLYHVQSLQHLSGVSFRMLRKEFERHKAGEFGQYVIWGFKGSSLTAWSDPLVRPHLTGKMQTVDGAEREDTGWKVFWDSIDILQDTGLLQFVNHVVSADSDEGEVIHPLAMIGTGEDAEQRITRYAHRAGHSMLAEWQQKKALAEGWVLVPVLRHIRDVALLGIPRLRYRARTAATAAWFDEESWKKWSGRYAAMQHPG